MGTLAVNSRRFKVMAGNRLTGRQEILGRYISGNRAIEEELD